MPGRRSGTDEALMRRALRLAASALGETSPNPVVGCVVARAGRVVGEGFHARAGGPHAEVVALRQAGSRARGATLYVTLEPCAHQGRTPPCAPLVRDAGVVRVVAAKFVKTEPSGACDEVGVVESTLARNQSELREILTGSAAAMGGNVMRFDSSGTRRSGDRELVTGVGTAFFCPDL